MNSFEVRHEVVGRARAGRPWRIAHLSDIHLWFDSRKLHNIERVLDHWQPEFIALTGDYADTPWGRRAIGRWVRALSERWKLGWIAGNHDRWLGGRMVRDLAAIPQVRCIDEGDFLVQGVNGHVHRVTTWKRRPELAAARPITTAADRLIVLCHDPAEFDPRAATGVNLVLAGHLHGGQFVMGRDPDGRSLPAGWIYRWCLDRWNWRDGALIVSRGLGDTLPLRYHCPREIVIADLW